jgi:anti-anti-sigma factor
MDIRRDQGKTICTVVMDQVWDDFNFTLLIVGKLNADDKHLILDLGFIELLHSPGLANLVALYAHCAKRGIELCLRRVNPNNRKLLRSTQLDRLFTIEDEVEPA